MVTIEPKMKIVEHAFKQQKYYKCKLSQLAQKHNK